jgi:hypothetical protein
MGRRLGGPPETVWTWGISMHCRNEGCSESIRPFWISREPVGWPWCNLAASQRCPYCASVNSHSPVGLVSRQWDAVDWACVLCDRRISRWQLRGRRRWGWGSVRPRRYVTCCWFKTAFPPSTRFPANLHATRLHVLRTLTVSKHPRPFDLTSVIT